MKNFFVILSLALVAIGAASCSSWAQSQVERQQAQAIQAQAAVIQAQTESIQMMAEASAAVSRAQAQVMQAQALLLAALTLAVIVLTGVFVALTVTTIRALKSPSGPAYLPPQEESYQLQPGQSIIVYPNRAQIQRREHANLAK